MMRPQRRDYAQGYPPQIYNNQMGGPNGPPMGGGPQQMNGMGGGVAGGPGGPQQMQNHGGMQLQGGGMGPNSASDGQSNSQAPSAPEMNLANVLHYLQSEWRRWERDRNEWEIERAEMRARIALLEGQRRSAENLKVDLLRRVKMLEFALRQERTKASTTSRPVSSGTPPPIPPSRLVALKDEETSSNRDEKEGSPGSSEGGDDFERSQQSKANGSAVSKVASHRPSPDTSGWKNLSGPQRDPKARARSREYLKQCLQEVTYLTSPGALNPLPTRAPVAVDENSASNGEPPGALDRPKKTLPDQPVPSMFSARAPPPVTQQAQSEAPKEESAASGSNAQQHQQQQPPPQQQQQQQHQQQQNLGPVVNGAGGEASAPPAAPRPTENLAGSSTTDLSNAPPSPAPRTVDLPESDDRSGGQEPQSQQQQQQQPRQVLTAIYKPESKAAWRDQLRAANEAASKVPWPPRRASDEEQLATLTLIDEEESETDGGSDRIWSTRRTLKSHLDIVRGVAIARGPDLVLASGGDDCTVKVWALDTPSVMSSKPHPSSELEPVATYRGHTMPVTTVTLSDSLGVVISGSMDSTIRVWKLPARDHDPYAPYDSSAAIQTLEGHTDVVWDVCLLPARPERNGSSSAPNGAPRRAESILVSVSADGTAKVWEERNGRWTLQASYSDFGEGVTPTCLAVDNQDYSRVMIGLSNGLVKVYSVQEDREVQTLGQEGSQVNAIVSHPTMPLVVTGHEDGYLHFIDLKASAPSPGLLAHPAPITSLALSPLSPMGVLSASVDCSVRLWDLQRKTSLQDLTGHRQRSDEGVTYVASHPELPVIASAGADGVVRLWGAG